MIYVFLPAYNEEIALPSLVKKFDDCLKNKQESNEPVNEFRSKSCNQLFKITFTDYLNLSI